MVGTLPITWQQWIDAFQWDQKNSLPLHHHLSIKHFELGYATRMRNHLAQQVLDGDMLNLMKVKTGSMFICFTINRRQLKLNYCDFNQNENVRIEKSAIINYMLTCKLLSIRKHTSH
jgi:hypothetical protein